MGKLTIISGGQAGVDRAALDVALRLGIPCAGWCQEGRLAEDGTIDEKYPLKETGSEDPNLRTRMNVDGSDGTIVIHPGQIDAGTAFTITSCVTSGKPLLEVDLSERYNIGHILNWLKEKKLEKINVAGPRESYFPGIYDASVKLLEPLLRDLLKKE